MEKINDKGEMVLVPEGSFLYGSLEDDKMASSNEEPQRIIDLPAFYIDKYLVTNDQFCSFLNNASPDKNTLEKLIDLTEGVGRERCRIGLQEKNFQIEEGYQNHPVIYVSWFGASAYAEWAKKRLPTEKEWEKASRGTRGSIYPWGNEFDKNLCNSFESGSRSTTAVDHFSAGKSPYECFDMAGNVWEWTDSWYNKEEIWRVVRGGSWFDGSFDCRCACRSYEFPNSRFHIIGFRCAGI